MMANLREMVSEANVSSFINKEFNNGGKSYQVAKADDFEYTDPIDGSVTKKQVGIVVTLTIEYGGLRRGLGWEER